MKIAGSFSMQRCLALVCLLACVASMSRAQIATISSDDQQTPQNGFKVKRVDTKIIDALADFNRYADKKAWELAFKAIQPLADADVTGMVPNKDGFYFPARQSVMRSFLSLSDEGRDAYRLFYDAKSKQMFDQATQHPDSSDDDVAGLRKIMDLYFITTSGQPAADRLGDALFEAGDYSGAAQAWGVIVEQQASSDLNIPRIQTKRAIAMIRNNQLADAGVVIDWLKQHAADAKTTIGGKEVSPVEYLTGLMQASAATQPATQSGTQPGTNPTTNPITDAANLPPVHLPESDTPRWHFKYIDDQANNQIQQIIRNYGWGYMMGDFLGFVPNAAADANHAYVNWLGVVYGLDAKTGKLLWRTDKPSDIGSNAQQFVQYAPDVKRYTVTAAGDKVLVVRIPPKRMNYQEPYRLQALDAQTGKQTWSSESGTMSNLDFACVPILVGDTVYGTAASRGGTEVQLIAVSLSNGKSQWTCPLGQAAAGNNWRGEAALPVFNLFYHNGNVYIVTNNGALLCVNTSDRRLIWSFSTGAGLDQSTQNMWGGYEAPQKIQTPAGIGAQGNIVYFKERDGEQMFAIDVSGPSLKWKRPIASSETIAGLDASHIYTVGADVGGIDETNHTLQWSTRLPVTTGMFQPMMSGNSIFMFIGRGIYQLDAAGGDIQRIFRGYDRDSSGGRILQTPRGIVTVSGQAVTAYSDGAADLK